MELTLKQKTAFGIGAVGKDMVYALSASYVMYYYQDVLRLSASFVGVVLMAARFFDAFNDPFMGVLVAKTRTRWGRFRPWIFSGTLLNALVHRDYSFSGSIIINVNDSKMEFISLGGLLPGLSTEDIRLGVSQPRNKKLAEIFHRLRLIESYGTGIRRIFKLYANCPVQPSIEATTNAFRIVLPNMNAVSAGAEIAAESKPAAPVITSQMKIVLDYLKEYGEMRDEELQELLHIKKTRAYLLTRQMSEEGLIEVVGRGAEKKYRLK